MLQAGSSEARRRRPAARRAARVGVVTVGVAVLGVVFAATASAHVKVSGTDAVQGGEGVVTFRVPSESDTASTTELLVTFPDNTPFTSADSQPKPGWTAKVTKKPLPKPVKDDDGDEITAYVSQVDFKATSPSAAIPPGEFDMFNLSVGPFPKAPSVSFDALQTYSDGTTVNWDEKSADGVTEPEHPAPTLQLTAADDAGAAATAQTPPAQAASSGGGTSWTGITGLVLGIIALLVAVAALLRGRSTGTAAKSR